MCYATNMSYRLAVLNNIHLLDKAKEHLQVLSSLPLEFPDDFETVEATLIARTGRAKAVLVSPGAKLTAHYFNTCPQVEYVGICGTSTANVDRTALKAHGATYTNVVNYGDEPTAEFIYMQLLELLRGTGKYQWQKMPCELMGKHIGIIGLGALGQAIMHLALAFKMECSYYSPRRKPDWEKRGAQYYELPKLLSSNEIIVSSGPTNTSVLGPSEFSLLTPGSILVQASMGNVFDRQAFLSWIAHEGNFALFDYAAGEENYQAYKDLPRVIFPKIIAGHTQETKERLGKKVIENLMSFYARP